MVTSHSYVSLPDRTGGVHKMEHMEYPNSSMVYNGKYH
jgi:hypothetical protein